MTSRQRLNRQRHSRHYGIEVMQHRAIFMKYKVHTLRLGMSYAAARDWVRYWSPLMGNCNVSVVNSRKRRGVSSIKAGSDFDKSLGIFAP